MKIWNPFLPEHEFVPDGEPHVYNQRVYLYGSHEKSHGTEFCTEDYVCWSAAEDELRDWRYEGVIYKKNQDPFNPDGSLCMYAPDVVQGTDGRFYLYYAFEDIGIISVAVCDEPAGQYHFYGHVHWAEQNGITEVLKKPFPFDPAVLNDDGRIYLYYGFCPEATNQKIPMLSNTRGSLVCELEADMLTVKTNPRYLIPGILASKDTSFEGHEFFEASSIRKMGQTYYFIYSSILSHELCYATSRYPDKEYVYQGILISNGDIGYQGRKSERRVAYTGNNHGSIALVNGEWYIFYHRHTQGIRCCRQACAEKLSFVNGKFEQAELTSQGLNGRPLADEGYYPAGICCNLIGKGGAFHIEGTADFRSRIPYVTEENGHSYIANIKDGTQIGYKYFAFKRENYRITILVRGQCQGYFGIWVDGGLDEYFTGQQGKQVAYEELLLNTETDQLIEIDCNITSGIHGLYMSFSGSGMMTLIGFTIN